MSTHIRDRIESTFAPLVGLPLWDHHRVLDLQVFHLGAKRIAVAQFGPRKGQTSIVGEYALHVQCAWRIIEANEIVVGSRDLYSKSSIAAIVSGDDWTWQRDNLRDERITAWFGKRERIIESIRADAIGGFAMTLRGGAVLEVFPDSSANVESWRLLPPNDEAPHFVVVGCQLPASRGHRRASRCSRVSYDERCRGHAS